MDMSKIFLKDACPTPIGGQAVLEGVMMRGTERTAIAVRTPGGDIHVKTQSNGNRSRLMKIPVIRGAAAFLNSLVEGTGTLAYSAAVLFLVNFKNFWYQYLTAVLFLWIKMKF